jgi:hypothetical protein
MKKTRGQKSRATVPLSNLLFFPFLGAGGGGKHLRTVPVIFLEGYRPL